MAEVEKIISNALNEGRQNLLGTEARELISTWEIPVPRSIQIKGVEDLKLKAGMISPPFVLKVISRDIMHKTEVGGVITGLRDENDVKNAFIRMKKDIEVNVPQARIEGFLLEEFIPGGVEVIIGGMKDPQFGPVVMFGIGGILVELMKDVSFRLAPLNQREAIEMMGEIKGYSFLTGYRGSKPVDIEQLASTIMKLSDIISNVKEIKEIEINPLFAYEGGVIAVDTRVVLEKGSEKTNEI
ncbi:acetate--CoA ligase family protein [Methanolobus mangrovi]|uniref:acetate--CoA ligase (ADP-forming) n=1 Tax=Methanolobus mangrovi TaxID=3072977 RepID=A0AA51YG45_9EURY|nr:acetate--CoA ligase family protein [Methanolobus mangrovi]WMW21572.1 acetate--CoA ligase family protein [Methanolobus mangrovi]